MKRSAIELDQITDEETESSERKITPGAKPKITYKQSMASYFVVDGTVHQVRTCEPATFHALASTCLQSCKRADLAAGDIAGLDYAQRIDKWFCLEVLRSRGAKLPLFASIEEAVHSMSSQQVNSSV